jgi:hypothetical protein
MGVEGMLKGKIKIEWDKKEVWITNNSNEQMYSGDPGTEVWSTVKMDKKSLKQHIRDLIRVWMAM